MKVCDFVLVFFVTSQTFALKSCVYSSSLCEIKNVTFSAGGVTAKENGVCRLWFVDAPAQIDSFHFVTSSLNCSSRSIALIVSERLLPVLSNLLPFPVH